MPTALITIGEYAKSFAKEDIKRPIIEMFAKSADLYDVIPFEGLKGSNFTFYRQAVLPVVSFRGINESSSAGHGTITPLQEATYVVDHNIDVDRAIIDRHGPERRNYEEQMGLTAFGQLFATKVIKGDQSTQPREFNGLQVRAAKYSRSFNNSTANGGGALSLIKLDQMINNVNGATHLVAPYAMKPLWIQLARNQSVSGYVVQTFDEIGRPKIAYAGLPILWGYPKDDHPPMLDFNEVGAGGGAAVTGSIYALSCGEGKFRGIQIKPMEVRDVGLLQDGITYRTHLSWDVGMVDEHKYCIGRLTSITNAAIVA